MNSWRDPILAQFTPEIASAARLTIVADPDALLTESGIIDGIRERGFDLITFNDHVRFRYEYEQRFRRIWDSGETTTLIVVLRAVRAEVESLPYDLLREARRHSRLLSFSLGELFPTLQPQVVGEIDRGDLDALARAVERYKPGVLGTNATRDFVLRHVFEVAPELIQTPAALLRTLLRRHYSRRTVPVGIDAHFISMLKKSGLWSEWPLDDLVVNRATFFQFLAERWPRFVSKAAEGNRIADAPETPMTIPGPRDIPFGHDDVKVYIDNLFTEGILEPTTAVSKPDVKGMWVEVGVRGDPVIDEKARFDRLIDSLDSDIAHANGDHRHWVHIAQKWAEAVALRWSVATSFESPDVERFHSVRQQLEGSFASWLEKHYSTLSSIAPWPRPVMVHHVPALLAHNMKDTHRHALVVVDGLSLDQWSVIRESFRTLPMEEDGVFAWVPTLTTVSRQAIFAGEPPFFFAPSIESTYKEANHWLRFWEDRGLKKSEVGYVCQKDREDDDAYFSRVGEAAEDLRFRALGIVVGTMDQMLHGVVTGTDGLHAGTRHWAQRGSLVRLVALLLNAGFDVALTADHGNVEGRGIGKPNVGATAEQRGERAHIFRDELIRQNVAGLYPSAQSWPSIGLPTDFLALIAPADGVFIPEGKRAVAHGGICIEEVIVPFIRFSGVTHGA